MNTTAPSFATDAFRATTDNFAKAFQAGAKFQEETVRSFSEAAGRNADEFRNRVERFADEVLPSMKKNAERFSKLFDEQVQRATTFTRQVFEQSPIGVTTNATEFVDRTMNVWKNAFEVSRESLEAFNKAGQDAWATWTQCCKGEPASATTTDSTARKSTTK